MSPEIQITKGWDTWAKMHKELGCYSCNLADKRYLGSGRCCLRQLPPTDLNLNSQTGECLDIDEICDHERAFDGRDSTRQVSSNSGGLSSPDVTHYVECPDCGKEVEIGTEGGV